jgi:hypothetical protein
LPVIEIPETDSKLLLSFVVIAVVFLSKYVGVRVGERNIAPGEPKASSSKVGRLVNRPRVGDFVGVFMNCISDAMTIQKMTKAKILSPNAS